jgi:hypothetical protein
LIEPIAMRDGFAGLAIVVDTRDRKTMVGDDRLPPLRMKPLIPSELRPDAAMCIPVHGDRAIVRLNRPDLKNCCQSF